MKKKEDGHSVRCSGGKGRLPGECVITAASLRLPRSSRWTTSSPSFAEDGPPREMWYRHARSVTTARSICFPSSGKIISEIVPSGCAWKHRIPYATPLRNSPMKECKECELAIYCYSDSTTWIFRTKQEMDEKRTAMSDCPLHQRVQQLRSAAMEECSNAQAN